MILQDLFRDDLALYVTVTHHKASFRTPTFS